MFENPAFPPLPERPRWLDDRTHEDIIAERERRMRAAGYDAKEIAIMRQVMLAPAPAPNPRRGPRTKWTRELNAELVKAVVEGRKGGRYSPMSVCARLATQKKWRDLLRLRGRQKPEDALRQYYTRLWSGLSGMYLNDAGEIRLAGIDRPKRRR